MNVLHGLAEKYQGGPRDHVPAISPAGYRWIAAEDAPAPAYVGFLLDDRQQVIVAALWDRDDHTKAALFPLDNSADRLMLPLVGHWKMNDGSLASIGVVEANSIALAVPTVPYDFFAETVRLARFPDTATNIRIIENQFAALFTTKARQLISGLQSSTAAELLAERLNGADPQKVLQALAEFDPRALPYVQNLAFRVRSILLERNERGALAAYIWSELSQ